MNAVAEPRRPTPVLVAAILGASLGFVGASVVNVALPTFQTALGADATDLQWVVSAYNLAIAALLLGAGAWSDRFGHVRTFRIGLVLYTAASIACGAATDPSVMICGRVAQGVGAALLVPSSLGLVNTMYPADARGHAVAVWSSFSAVGAGMGPFLGGFLIDVVSWRFIFWMNVPVAVAAAWLVMNVPPSRPHETDADAFDWPGAAYSVIALGLLTFSAIETSQLGLGHPLVVAAFGAAIFSAWRFVRRERRAAAPMIPLALFRSREFSAANAVTFLAYCTIGGGFYVMMLTWIQIQGYSALVAGTIALPFMLMTAAFAHPVATIVRRLGARLPLTAGLVLLGTGFLSWVRPDVGTSFWSGYFPGVISTAIGIALIVGPVTYVVVGAVDVRYSATASGINSAVARTATLLSIAVLGAVHFQVFETQASRAIDQLGLAREAAGALRGELINMAAARIPETLDPDMRDTVRSLLDAAFLAGTRSVVAIAGALALAAAVIAFRRVERGPNGERGQRP